MRIEIEKVDFSEHGAHVRVTVTEWSSEGGRSVATYLTNHQVYLDVDPQAPVIGPRTP